MMWPYAASLLLPLVLLRRCYGLRFVGLTGGIASGKSSVTHHLRHVHHLPVIDFDVLAREVVDPRLSIGRSTLSKLRATFGSDVILADGQLDRAALSKRIFNDANARRKLNSIMQTPIRIRFLKAALDLFFRQGHREVILDVPLLFESKLHLLCSETVVVFVSPEMQRKRLMERDTIDATAADAKINAQWSLSKKRAMADTVIVNDGSLQDLHTSLDGWWAAHVARMRTEAWRKWIPTVPSLLLTLVAAPVLFASTAFVQWFVAPKG